MKFLFLPPQEGDKVRYVGLSGFTESGKREVEYGEIGTAMLIQGNCVAVEWNDKKEWRHDCGGRCRDKHGWWVPKYEVIPI